jgi:hypothetical protein
MEKFDFYTIQICVDGFGNDTLIDTIWKTKEDAEKEIRKIKNNGAWGCPPQIVGGFF